MEHRVYIGLGANLGDRETALQRALEDLRVVFGEVRCSPFYETEPRLDLAQPAFLNAVAEVSSALSPLEILRHLQAIEQQQGRTRDPERSKGPRELDLDLLVAGPHQSATPQLQLPHHGIADRRFVLKPLCDLAPDLVPPGSALSVHQMLDRCSDQGWIHAMKKRTRKP